MQTNSLIDRMEIDLHGYPVWQALEVADEKIKEAWTKGLPRSC